MGEFYLNLNLDKDLYNGNIRKQYDMKSRIENARRAFDKKDISIAKKAHSKDLIHKQIQEEEASAGKGQFLGEFVYGAIDGTVTTFAIVSGATGASLSPVIVIILGFANLLADGFSMACGNFLSERTQRDFIEKERKREEWEIENIPEGEKEEIREIFKKKGFVGKDLDRAVEIITSNKNVWVDTMMADELGLLESQKSPWKTAGFTYFGFITIGIIPLLSYLLSYFIPLFKEHTFGIAVFLTFTALVTIGIIKRQITKKVLWKSVLETVFIGGTAAGISYYIGYLLKILFGA